MKVNLSLLQTRGIQAQKKTSIAFSARRDLSLRETEFAKAYRIALETGNVQEMKAKLENLTRTKGDKAPETRGVRAAISEAIGEND